MKNRKRQQDQHKMEEDSREAKVGAPPLLSAAMYESPDAIIGLINAGANVNEATENGETPLHAAIARMGYDESLTPVQAVKELIQRGADVNKSDKKGCTPLMQTLNVISRRMGNTLDIFKVLLEAGALIGDVDHAGVGVIDHAMKSLIPYGSILTLCEHGLSVDAKMENGDPLVLKAASLGHLGLVESLLSRGANPHVIGVEGDTLLMCAVKWMGTGPEYHMHRKIIGLLLATQPDLLIKNNQGQTALDLVKQRDSDWVGRLTAETVKQALLKEIAPRKGGPLKRPMTP